MHLVVRGDTDEILVERAMVDRAEAESVRDVRIACSFEVGDERRYLKAVRRYPHAAVFVAERSDGAMIGRLSLARDTHPASTHVADLGLMVAKDARRQGVGKALLEAAVEWARGNGVRKLELHVFPWNEPAIQLYERFGFEREGFRKGHYSRAGEDVDAILMAYAVDLSTHG